MYRVHFRYRYASYLTIKAQLFMVSKYDQLVLKNELTLHLNVFIIYMSNINTIHFTGTSETAHQKCWVDISLQLCKHNKCLNSTFLV